jgi:hypothetical protein
MELLLVLSPNLKTSSMKAAYLLEEIGNRFDTLLLKFPKELEEDLIKRALGAISVDQFIDEAVKRNLIPEPFGAWEYTARPFLYALPKIFEKCPNLSIRCYSNSENEFASVDIGVEIAKLTLRTALTGNVEIREWREKLLQSLDINRESRETQTQTILEKVGEDSICISDIGGRYLIQNLKEAGISVKIQYVERPYHFNPLMILERLMSKRRVEDTEIEKLVKSHLEYIKSYVYMFDNRDRAHYEWVFDKIPWLRQKINKDELKALDYII